MPFPVFTLPVQQMPPASAGKPRLAFKAPYVPIYGANASVLFFSSARTRARFGSSVLGYGPGLGPTFGSNKGRWGFDTAVYATEGRFQGGFAGATLVLFGGQYRLGLVNPVKVKLKSLGSPPQISFRRYAPYIAGSVHGVLANVTSVADGIRGNQIGMGVSAALGTSITTNGYLEVRYRLMRPLHGFDFSGLVVGGGFRF